MATANAAIKANDECLWIDISTCARRLGLARSYVYQAYVMTGQLRTFKAGRRRVCSVDELARFAKEFEERQFGVRRAS